MQGYKHLVECNCVLPQFKSMADPPFHKFVVFSVIDDADCVVSKLAQCNNCGVIHRVTDICKSEIIVSREASSALLTRDDVLASLPKEIADVLVKNECDLPTCEQIMFVIDNELWGTSVVITSEVVDGVKQGKMLRVLGRSIFKIVPYPFNP